MSNPVPRAARSQVAMRAAVAVATLAVVVLLGAANGGAAPAQTPVLRGEVGPGFEISLRNAQGARVTQLDPGTYVVRVEDKSQIHSFHLEGPGVNEQTDVEFTGTVEWTVTFVDGRYRLTYVPDPIVPVVEWLRHQKRFAHLLEPEHAHIVETIQRRVDDDAGRAELDEDDVEAEPGPAGPVGVGQLAPPLGLRDREARRPIDDASRDDGHHRLADAARRHVRGVRNRGRRAHGHLLCGADARQSGCPPLCIWRRRAAPGR